MYEELIDKYGSSPMLLNGLAVSKMHQGLFEEAETHLQEALTKVIREFLISRLFFLITYFTYDNLRFHDTDAVRNTGPVRSGYPSKPCCSWATSSATT